MEKILSHPGRWGGGGEGGRKEEGGGWWDRSGGAVKEAFMVGSCQGKRRITKEEFSDKRMGRIQQWKDLPGKRLRTCPETEGGKRR